MYSRLPFQLLVVLLSCPFVLVEKSTPPPSDGGSIIAGFSSFTRTSLTVISPNRRRKASALSPHRPATCCPSVERSTPPPSDGGSIFAEGSSYPHHSPSIQHVVSFREFDPAAVKRGVDHPRGGGLVLVLHSRLRPWLINPSTPKGIGALIARDLDVKGMVWGGKGTTQVESRRRGPVDDVSRRRNTLVMVARRSSKAMSR